MPRNKQESEGASITLGIIFGALANQIDNDVNRGILCFAAAVRANRVSQNCRATFAPQLGIVEVTCNCSTHVNDERRPKQDRAPYLSHRASGRFRFQPDGVWRRSRPGSMGIPTLSRMAGMKKDPGQQGKGEQN